MNKANTFIVGLAVLVVVSLAAWLLLAAPGLTGDAINMRRGVTPLSISHYNLHMIILWVCVVIGVLVFTAMFTSIILHRKSKGVQPAKFTHSTKAEIIWTIIPIVILIAMAVPATTALIKMESPQGAEMTVKVTGFQWKWKYDYVDDGISFVSSLKSDSNAARQLSSGIDPQSVDHYLLNVDHPLVLPVGKKIKFLITADDVIHSWWVPDFGWKRDAIPGFVNEAWVIIEQPGTYRGQCAELCGKDHGFMPIVIRALPAADYRAWVDDWKRQQTRQSDESQRNWTRAELMARGSEVYASQCATCHQADGQGLAPAFPPLAGSPVVTGPIDEQIRVVLEGRPGTAMRGWRELLSPADIAAALTYTRNAFGNDTGDLVQPRVIAGMN